MKMYEKLYWMKGQYDYQIIKSDIHYYLRLNIMLGSIFAVDEGGSLILKLENGKIVTLNDLKYSNTDIDSDSKKFGGSDAMGINLYLAINAEDLKAISNSKIVKIRLYSTDSYVDIDVNPNRSLMFLESAKHILQH
ncbi:MAG: hypothetical protein KAS71_15080 [Bacteroidales bacterium]|nr:hypothetical protein [Bacteroidales bacterium]